jgi:hypothetical protein
MLSCAPRKSKCNIRKIVREMLRYRDRHGPVLGKEITVRQLIDEGRR